MPWPQSTDYNLAIQNPHLCFLDEDLRACTAFSADPVLGLPTPRAGNFADVYQMIHPGGRLWAVKCFTREVEDLHDRYTAISAFLERNPRSFIVEFRYLDQGILVDGVWYPVLKMRWVEGRTLNEFIGAQADKAGLLDKLALMWLKLAQDLRDLGIGHGDLQHGNVLLVPNPQKASLHLRLIDYDGMYVPALADRPSREAGFPGFQHPRRGKSLFGPEVDRFSHLVIYTALRALRTGGAKLWATFGTMENLLFSEGDFTRPAKSELLRTLFATSDVALRHLVGHLVLAAAGPVGNVPLLNDIAPGGAVRRLEMAEFERLREIVGPMIALPRRSKLEGRTPAPRLDDLPPLPAPLRGTTHVDLVSPINGMPEVVPVSVPQARRLEDSLPDWMLPEAMPLDDTFVRALPEDAEEEHPFAVAPLMLVPMQPVERAVPAIPRMTPVLVEEETRPEPVETVPGKSPAARKSKIGKARTLEEPVTVTPIEEAEPDADDGQPALGLFLAAVIVVFCSVLGGVMVFFMRHEPEPTPRPEVSIPTHATLQLPAEVALEGGQQRTVLLRFQPHLDRSPFAVRVLDLPPKIELKEVTAPEPTDTPGVQSVSCTLAAPLDVPANSLLGATVQLLQGERVVDEQRLRIVLTRPNFPTLAVPISQHLSQHRVEIGKTEKLSFRIERNGRKDRLRVEFSNLPDGVQQDPVEAGPGDNQAVVEVRVPRRQGAGSVSTEVRLLLIPEGGTPFVVDRKNVSVIFGRPRPKEKFLTAPAEGVRIEAGKTAMLRVDVDRTIEPAALKLELLNLPAGVTASTIEVAASEGNGVFLLTATAATPATTAAAVIVARRDGDEMGRSATTVRVVR